MATVVEMTAQLVAAHAGKKRLGTDQLLAEIGAVYAVLRRLRGDRTGAAEAEPVITVRDAFKEHEVVCLLCGKGGYQTLTRHLGLAHQMKPQLYKKRFGIPADQPLSSQSFSDSRKQLALELGLAENLVKAREVRLAKFRAKKDSVQDQSGRNLADARAVPLKGGVDTTI